MNPTDIHGMALALGLPSALAQIEAVKQLVAEAVANEREACAKVVEAIEARCIAKDVDDPPLEHVAAAIRARGQQ